jgi:RNase H-like domain found in reverse transcriptase
VLKIPDFSRKFYVKIDTSDFIIKVELYQTFDDRRYPVRFILKKISGLAFNYLIYNKKLIAIIKAFNK